MKKFQVSIRGDTNDADYITETSFMNEDELICLRKVADAINKCSESHNWITFDDDARYPLPRELYANILTQDDIEWFGDLLPYGERGIHSVDRIEIVEIVVGSEERLV